jgi:hypothetical protein
VAGVGMAVGDIPTAYGLSPWISLAVGAVILWIVLRTIGKPTEAKSTVSIPKEEAVRLADPV